jgi:hypothetical protein
MDPWQLHIAACAAWLGGLSVNYTNPHVPSAPPTSLQDDTQPAAAAPGMAPTSMQCSSATAEPLSSQTAAVPQPLSDGRLVGGAQQNMPQHAHQQQQQPLQQLQQLQPLQPLLPADQQLQMSAAGKDDVDALLSSLLASNTPTTMPQEEQEPPSPPPPGNMAAVPAAGAAPPTEQMGRRRSSSSSDDLLRLQPEVSADVVQMPALDDDHASHCLPLCDTHGSSVCAGGEYGGEGLKSTLESTLATITASPATGSSSGGSSSSSEVLEILHDMAEVLEEGPCCVNDTLEPLGQQQQEQEQQQEPSWQPWQQQQQQQEPHQLQSQPQEQQQMLTSAGSGHLPSNSSSSRPTALSTAELTLQQAWDDEAQLYSGGLGSDGSARIKPLQPLPALAKLLSEAQSDWNSAGRPEASGSAMIGGAVLLKLETLPGLFAAAAGPAGTAVDWPLVLSSVLAPYGRLRV